MLLLLDNARMTNFFFNLFLNVFFLNHHSSDLTYNSVLNSPDTMIQNSSVNKVTDIGADPISYPMHTGDYFLGSKVQGKECGKLSPFTFYKSYNWI
jgi:hypothetical protein